MPAAEFVIEISVVIRSHIFVLAVALHDGYLSSGEHAELVLVFVDFCNTFDWHAFCIFSLPFG